MEVIWESMNFNAPDFDQAPNRLRRPAGAHELLPMIAPAYEFEAYLDLGFGFLVSGSDPRHVPSNVTQSRRFYPALLRQRAVVRGGLSLGLVLGLLCFGAICFFCMIGPQGTLVDSAPIVKGQFSDNRPIHLLRNVP
jgi:hypothetical protein